MKSLLYILLGFSMLGCAHTIPLGEKEDVWVAVEDSFFGFHSSTIYYCRSLKEPDGKKVNPQCFEAHAKPKNLSAPQLSTFKD